MMEGFLSFAFQHSSGREIWFTKVVALVQMGLNGG